jgi:selenocysteine-specific elongation factor
MEPHSRIFRFHFVRRPVTPSGNTYTIVGVIGHIDHGKTSLVTALTGVNTDTHPEEQLRGITIDLGFASFTSGDHTFALIDAPGHQKYIGNLLAGVSGIDVGLLVVASDQGIQAQTLEHAAILHSLGVSKLIVVISRMDLTDTKTRADLSEELDVFLADFGFLDIPKVCVSSVTGEGLPELIALLIQHARTTSRSGPRVFRMPIDRVFTIDGRGCVVAGTLWSGEVAIGDHVQLSRSGDTYRVRGLEVHGQSVERSEAGYRTAMNLVGVSSTSITRGDELVAEKTHPPTQRMVIEITMFRETAELKCPATVQFHSATTSCDARIMGVKRLGPGDQTVVVVDTDEPVIATHLQQCLFRRPYPIGSFAGGRVLASVVAEAKQTTRLLELGRNLVQADPVQRVVAWVNYSGELPIDPEWCEMQMGIAREDVHATFVSALNLGLLQIPVDGIAVSSEALDRIRKYVLKLLKHQAESTADAWLVEEAILKRATSTGSPRVVRWVLQQLIDEKLLVRVNQRVAVASEENVLSKKQRQRMDQILEMYSGSRMPPTVKEVAQQLDTTIEFVASLMRFATQQRILVDLGGGFFIAADALEVLCRELQTLFQQSPERSVAEIRDQWQITRKHAIPLLEYCDAQGITQRKGDVRSAGPELAKMLPSIQPADSSNSASASSNPSPESQSIEQD